MISSRSPIKQRLARGLSRHGLLPDRYRDRIRRIETFADKELKWSDGGYWYLDPMPSEEDLDWYYASLYWSERPGKSEAVGLRDIEHWQLLTTHIPTLASSPIRFLNFGAGHGGVSWLMHAAGHDVVNVEPSGIDAELADRWSTVRDLREAEGPFDLVYGSHSLEHVQDLDEFMGLVRASTRPGGHIFFEVPNCRQTACHSPRNGGQDGVIRVPHTYYFSRDYFAGLPFRRIHNATYLESGFPRTRCEADEGSVIVFLGAAQD